MKKQLLLFVLMMQALVAMADASGKCGTNLTWTYTEGTKTLSIEGSGAMEDYYSASKVPWYSYKEEIEKVIVGPNATRIGSFAFYHLSKVIYVYINGTVTRIGSDAFNGCSSLTSITIPNSVTNISSSAFSNCSSLTSIKVESGNTVYDSRDNCNAIIETATNILRVGCKSTIILNSVARIGNYAFYGCSGLTSVTIPNSVTSIGDYAFVDCYGLTTITIPNSVTSIGGDAFRGCAGLTSITIPNSVMEIGRSAFSYCSSLTSIKVESGNTKYDSRDNCNAIIETGNNVLMVGCKSTIFPNSVTSIGDEAFRGCSSLTSITIPNSVTSIGIYAFNDCLSLTSITIPNSVTSIEQSVFGGCSGLTSITIPNSVTSIVYGAFRNCSGLTMVSIGNGVKSIDDWTFSSCSNLKDLYLYAEQLPTVGTNAFSSTPIENSILHVPSNMLIVYQSITPWKEFKEIVGIDPSGIEQISIKENGNGNINQDGAAWYTIDGKRASEPQQGLNIIRMNNGTTRKVVVK